MNWKGIYTMLYQELSTSLSVWKQTVIAPVISNVLFMVVFGVTLSSRPSAFEEYTYLQVLIPGLVALAVMMNPLQKTFSTLILAKYTNNIGDILMLPMRGFELSLAYILSGLFRGFLVGAATLVAGRIFTPLAFAYPLYILVFATLLGAATASLGVMIGIVAKDFDQASIIPTFILQPLIYLGGVFYSISTLPGVFGTLSRFNPIFYMIDGFRYGFLGVGDAPILLSLTITAVITAVMFIGASWMFETGYKIKP